MAKTIHLAASDSAKRRRIERINRFARAELRSTTAQAEILLDEAMDARDRQAEGNRLAAVEAGERTDDEG